MQHKAALFTLVFVVSCGGGTFEPAGSGGAQGSGGKVGVSGGAASGGKPGSGGRPGSGGAVGAGGGGALSGGTSAGGAASGGASTGGANGGACAPPCGDARECCGGQCVNPTNDPFNCGSCGHKCTGTTYCGGGQCVEPPCTATCSAASGSCCGSECCGQGKLCCDPQGPLDRGPTCTTPNEQGTCPMGCAPLCICASPDTPIATPSGNREIASLRVGDLVYSVDHGILKLVPLLEVHHTPVSHHSVVRVELASGAVLEISGRHPTADGRSFSTLAAGAFLDGVQIKSVSVVPYHHQATYDILPASDSGAYFAGGVLVGSTLAHAPALVMAPTVPLSTMDAR